MVSHEMGKPAVTEFKRMSVADGQSRLRLFPKTGRSHQLRVHCLAIGHPILGDPLYAPETVADFPRLLLHSEELRINTQKAEKDCASVQNARFDGLSCPKTAYMQR